MAEQGDSPCGAPEGTRPGATLSDSLVTTRSCSTGPLPTSTLRLDRENLSCIGKLRRMAEIHSLYLQQNQIEKIENLESFPNLRFLCLAGNRIQRVENLQALPQLSTLDLSHNQIRALDAEELPRSLRILDLTGNECSRQDGYRDLVVAALPHLLQLDSQPIHGDTAREEAGGGSCSSEEEEEDEELFPELRIPFTVDKDFLQDVQRELAGRARWRRRKSLEEHRARLEELRELRALLLDPGQGQLCPQGAQLSPLPASRVSQRAPGAIQPPGKALEKEPGAKGAGNGQLSQISCSSSKE
ncbi:leucine-rich repeat-containing protein 46 isoform X2 [Parus major]|uniref:leucine-rich repeat-containing protein 46 isoform X2 n=1 Tax=Parus major TaxID=9157 RepID=UPI0007715B9A|nr:leucine-rich repeat-containing protein 46 isoform X2 [Parus major]XP_033367502.1 leucine-rich repeat-containing protein 46 isoform X2 [Parus major]